MKIRKKYLPIWTAVIIGLSMGLIMSFVMTLINVGLVQNFFLLWLKSFAVGALVGIPLALVLVPAIARQLQKIAVD